MGPLDLHLDLPAYEPERPNPQAEAARRLPGTAGLSDNVLQFMTGLTDVAEAQTSMIDLWLGQGDEPKAMRALQQGLTATAHISDARTRWSTDLRMLNIAERSAKQYGASQLMQLVRQAKSQRLV